MMLSRLIPLSLLIVIATIGCGDDAAPSDDKNGNTGKAAADDVPATDADTSEEQTLPIDLTQTAFMAEEFARALASDAPTVAAALAGKTIQLNGSIAGIGHEVDRETADGALIELGDAFIRLSAGIKCLTQDSKPWRDFSRGQFIIVTGKFLEQAPVMFECEVEPALGDASMIVASAKEIADEFEQDPETAVADYWDWRTVRVIGIVEEVATNADGVTRVTLSGNESLRVRLEFTVFEIQRLIGLAPGDELTAVGEFEQYLPDMGIVTLRYCLEVRTAK